MRCSQLIGVSWPAFNSEIITTHASREKYICIACIRGAWRCAMKFVKDGRSGVSHQLVVRDKEVKDPLPESPEI